MSRAAHPQWVRQSIAFRAIARQSAAIHAALLNAADCRLPASPSAAKLQSEIPGGNAMKNTLWQKTLLCTGVLVMASRFGYSDSPGAMKLSGIINDHTAVSAGSWELHGEWSLKTKGNGTGDFSAVLTMERSDYWAMTSGGDPNARSQHTHHITLTDATVTPITGGFEVSGSA